MRSAGGLAPVITSGRASPSRWSAKSGSSGSRSTEALTTASRVLRSAGGDAHGCGFLRGSGNPIALGPNGARRRHDPIAARSDRPEGHRVTITAEPTAHTVDRDRAIDTRHHVRHEPRSTGRARAMIEGIEGERVDRVEWGGEQLAHEARPYRDRVVNACGQAARNPAQST